MRLRSPTRRLQVESLEKRLALAADFVVDGDTTSNPAAQIAMVGSDLYFSTNNGTETQIRRYSNGSLINLAQHQVFGDFGNAAPTFFHEVGNGLMYGLTGPFFQEHIADATFQIWYASAGAPPRLIRELPVMATYGSYQPPTDVTAVNDSLLLRDAWMRYQLINTAGMTLDTWAAPADPTCANPNYGPAHADGDGVAIAASYNCRTFLTPLYVRTDGITLDEVDVHPSSLYLPNGTQISSAFSRDRNAEELIFETTSGREAIDANGKPLKPESLTRFGTDKVFFSADDQTRGREPWITDGTRAGTQMLRDISGLASSDPEVMGQTPHGLLFAAFSEGQGRELWVTDGNPAGTRLLQDIYTGQGGSNPTNVTTSLGMPGRPIETQSDSIFFWADTPNNGRELWSTDGTASGTHRVASQILGPSGAELTAQAALPNGTTILAFSDNAGNMQVFTSNGTKLGTRRIDSLPSADRVVQIATSDNSNRSFAVQLASGEIWVVDAASGNATNVWSVTSSNLTFGLNPKNITKFGDRVLFTTDVDNKSNVWVWDPATRELSNPGIIAMRRDMTISVLSDRMVLFTEFNVVRVLKDGQLSALGTQLVLQHESVGGYAYLLNSRNDLTIIDANKSVSQPNGKYFQLTVHEGRLYAINESGLIVRFNGTTSTILQNTEIDTASQLKSGPSGSLWVVHNDRFERLELSTARVVETHPFDETPQDVTTNAEGQLFWRSLAARSIRTIRGGTIVDLVATGDLAKIEEMTAVGNKIFFLGVNSRQKRSLWVSDGTVAGSVKIAVIPGLDNFTSYGQKLYFSGDHAVWESDGTIAGTTKLSQIGTQFVRSTADELSVVGNDLYFAASDGIHGKELFSYALSTTGEVTGEVMGDANGDARVDFADFLILSSEFGKTMPQSSRDADFDDDGRVNFTDFLLLSSNFNKPRS